MTNHRVRGVSPFVGGPRARCSVGAEPAPTEGPTKPKGMQNELPPNSQESEEIRPNVYPEVLDLGLINMHSCSNVKSLPVGGRLANFTMNWEILTQDEVILDAIKGYKIEFVQNPLKFCQNQENKENMKLVENEIQDLLDKNAVELVEFPIIHNQVLSNIFIRQKKDGGLRPIFNLKGLNKHIQYHHFKMEGFLTVKNLIQKGDYMVKVDLKDAYLSILIHEDHRKYLRFLNSEGQTLQFRSLPFGLASGPRLFTKIMKPLVAFLRRIGIRLVIYLDDILIMNQSQDALQRDRDSLIWILQNLGFVINWKKSQLTPTQNLEFLGFLIDSVMMKVTLPENKIHKILDKCNQALNKREITIQELSSLVGLLNASRDAIVPTTLYVREMQMHQTKQLLLGKNFQSKIKLSKACKEEIKWWINHVQEHNGKQLLKPSPDLMIESDASNLGWGAVCQDMKMGGPWSKEEKKLHINALELKAAHLALKSVAKNKTDMLVWGPILIDLFADRLNNQTPAYFSWRPDPGALGIDAFMKHWGQLKAYAFPPFCLIPRVLAKVMKDKAKIVIITPSWQTQAAYPMLLSMAVDCPILLPPIKNLLTSPEGQAHPLILDSTLKLVAWKVSGEKQEQEDFRMKLQTSWWNHGERELRPLTTPAGNTGVAGVMRGTWIPFRPLWSM
ncbi:hypothetical protein FSP39_008608 [Pinctada imbricata]|uniref:Reverse transcriptase domain-containing protein n=1 Tax=Pinctada imbricata TaxID=66713 RepID=A0AA88XZD8_PINIB|nr:hypothetical protein FSP39_008608 [Pinctada imbricata]